MQLYIYLLIRTCNPDNRSSCFGLRLSHVLSYIYGGSRYSEMSGVLRCYLIRVSLHHAKWIINKRFLSKIFMGLQRTIISLHFTILEKGSLTLCSKRFSKLSSKIFMGFYFQSCRERVPSLHPIIFEKGSMTLLTKGFPTYQPNYLWVFILVFAEKGYNKPYYYATVHLLVNLDT